MAISSVVFMSGAWAHAQGPLIKIGFSLRGPKLVFDVIERHRFLSEVWLPGQDGCLVGSVTGSHEQQILGGTKRR